MNKVAWGSIGIALHKENGNTLCRFFLVISASSSSSFIFILLIMIAARQLPYDGLIISFIISAKLKV